MSDWPEHCDICEGTGKLTFGRIARFLNEDDGVIRRLHRMRVRAKTAERVFQKIMELL